MFKKSDNKEGCLWKALEAALKKNPEPQEFKVKVAMELQMNPSNEPPPHQEEIVLPANIKSKINQSLNAISTHDSSTYYDSIPLGTVQQLLKSNGITMLDIDGTVLTGVILTGRTGKANYHLALQGKLIKNSLLITSWHKMESGRYEFLVYLS